jgi:hypothetical protein
MFLFRLDSPRAGVIGSAVDGLNSQWLIKRLNMQNIRNGEAVVSKDEGVQSRATYGGLIL